MHLQFPFWSIFCNQRSNETWDHAVGNFQVLESFSDKLQTL